MTVTRRDDVEEIIVQALGNRERRNIIEILGTSVDGVTYSEILGEIGLNTGKMNTMTCWRCLTRKNTARRLLRQ